VALVGGALAAEGIQVSRKPLQIEIEKPEDPPRGNDYKAMEAYEVRQAIKQMKIRSADNVVAYVRLISPVIAKCYADAGGTGGSASVKLTVNGRSEVSSVKPTAGDPALGTCLAGLAKQQWAVPVYNADASIQLDVTAPAPSPGTPAPPMPLDLDAGLGPVVFGDEVDSLPGASMTSQTGDTQFYQAEYDALKWFGATTSGITYGFGPDGFYVAMIRVPGENGGYVARQGLKARYGSPRWDPTFKAFYWRGDRVYIEAREVGEGQSTTTLFTVLDIAMAKAAGSLTRLAGEGEMESQTGRLPKIMRK
jgi:hypothetical protein